jgi:hypothetical protein
MTTDVLRVPGDYIVIAKDGDVTVDLQGTTTGTFRILGNFEIVGTSTQIITTNTWITDRILTLNYDGTPPLEPAGNVSGILIDSFSGSTSTARMLWNDGATWNNGSAAYNGLWEFKATDTLFTAIRAAAIQGDTANNGALNLIGTAGTGTVNVKGTTDYENYVLHDDDIPNKAYVDNRSLSTATEAKRLLVGNSRVELLDSSVSPPFYNANDLFKVTFNTSDIVFRLEQNQAVFQTINFNNNVISVNTTTDIIFQPPGTRSVIINSELRLGRISTSTTATAVLDQTSLYYKEPAGGGGTGIYFVNTPNGITERRDELVSRRRAIVYGIIF